MLFTPAIQMRTRLTGLLFIIGLTLPGCVQEPAPLNLGTNIWPGYEPLYLAREQELFSEQQIHLVEYTSASQVLNAYRNGIIDAAALTMDEVFTLQSEGLAPKILLVLDISKGGDAILGHSGITTFKQLQGKRVGVENTALGAYFLSRALQKNDMDEDDIQIVPIEHHQHIAYFNSHKVDAVVSFEPVCSTLKQQGATVLFDSSMLDNEIVDVLVIDNRAYATHQQQFQSLKDAWYRAIEQVKARDPVAMKIINRRLQLDKSSLLSSYDGLLLPDRALNHQLISGPQPGLLATSEKLAHTMLSKKLVQGTLNPADLFTDMKK
ncbi:MAG: ABC transporter substrate-binding protein [Gammaproteobacteria bacterium]|nr:ABC transporter substrate-binding protein [Gammaproteobacteria bacterium]